MPRNITNSYTAEPISLQLKKGELAIIIHEYVPYPQSKNHRLVAVWQANDANVPLQHVLRDLEEARYPQAGKLNLTTVAGEKFTSKTLEYIQQAFDKSEIGKELPSESKTINPVIYKSILVDDKGKVTENPVEKDESKKENSWFSTLKGLIS